MAKKVKGKQRDQVAAVHPSAAVGHDPRTSSATPKHIMSRLDTGVTGFPGATSPQHARQELGMSSQAGDTWGSAPGGWGAPDAEQGNNGGWGAEAHETGPWGPGPGTGTGTHTSPAAANSPMPGLWGQDAAPPPEPEQNGYALNSNLLSAALGMISFGAQPAANAGATPTLKKKSTLKKSPPAAAEASLPHGVVSSPASRHVAFGATSLYSPTSAAPPPAPPAPPYPSALASQKNPAASRAMHSRNHTYGGWESGFGAPTAPQPGFGRSQSAYPAAAAAAPVSMPQGAWTKWGKEAQNIGRPRVATTIAASVPTASVPAAAQHAASAAVGHRAAALAQHNAQLQSLLSHPGQSKMHRRQASEPAYPSATAQSQNWSAWGQSGQPAAAHHTQKQHKSHRPQQMQHSDSWNEWQDTGGGAEGAWGPSDHNTGYGDTWDAPATGGWDTGGGGAGSSWDTGGGGGWDASNSGGGGGGGWNTDGGGGGGGNSGGWTEQAGDRSSRGRSGRKKERDDGGWGTSKGDKGRTHKAHNDGDWGQWDRGRHGTIHEEDEEEYDEEEEEDGYDDLDDMYTDPEDDYNDRHKVREGISYQYQSPTDYGAPAPPGLGFGRQQQAATLSPIAFSTSKPQGSPMLPSPQYSRTMNMAAGRTTTVFELAPPRQGLGENTFASSNGAALQTAQRALYSRQRLARERIFWAFNPEKDPRVASLMRWIQAMSNGLATIGLQKFIETGERGALITNADYRVNGGPGGLTQPSFDWVPLEQLRWTYDKVLQESVVCYKPSSQVIVFVFLLSKSGNSMAMWRRKLTVPETVRAANKDAIRSVLEEMDDEKKVVYVDQMPSPKVAPPEPKKKRGFWRKLFGLKAKEKKT